MAENGMTWLGKVCIVWTVGIWDDGGWVVAGVREGRLSSRADGCPCAGTTELVPCEFRFRSPSSLLGADEYKCSDG